MVTKAATDLEGEAARWFVRWNDASEASGRREQARWFSWLRRSPAHVAAYFAMDEMSTRLAESPALVDLDVDAWMSARRARVIHLATRSPLPERPSLYSSRLPAWTSVAAASVASVTLGALILWHFVSGDTSFRTGRGEQKTVQLTDGSLLQLNTNSRARVSFTDGAREIQLEGEALFTVARDSHRPFRVRTHDATVRAIGTRFNVYDQGDSTRIAVLEGRVRVYSTSPLKSFELGAGEEAQVSRTLAQKESAPNVSAATAWQSRVLIFERARLADVAGEFNRYNKMQFRVDPATGETNRLSGTFDARHPESLLLWLQSRNDIEVRKEGSAYVVRDSPGVSPQPDLAH